MLKHSSFYISLFKFCMEKKKCLRFLISNDTSLILTLKRLSSPQSPQNPKSLALTIKYRLPLCVRVCSWQLQYARPFRQILNIRDVKILNRCPKFQLRVSLDIFPLFSALKLLKLLWGGKMQTLGLNLYKKNIYF